MSTDIFELDVHSLSHDGRAVGRLDNRVIFVEGALPEQRVRVKITKSKKNFAEAICLEVLKEAPQSIEAPCPHAAVCGGCALQTMPAATQVLWKERMVLEAMTRIGKLSPQELECIQPLVPSPKAWGYRNKMEFAFGQDAENNLVLGLRGKGSHAVQAVPQCALLPQGCMDVVQKLRNLCHDAGLGAWAPAEKNSVSKNTHREQNVLRHVVVRRPHTTLPDGKAQLLINLITAPACKDVRLRLARLGKDLMQSCSEVTGFVLEERRSATMIAQGEHIITSMGNTTLQEKLGGVEYTFGHNAFFQINTEAAENLCTELAHMAATAAEQQNEGQDFFSLWDVYCGVGAPGLNLARHLPSQSMHLHGVEINPKAIDMAQKNAQNAHVSQAKYTASDAKRALGAWPAPHMILLDPPRAGLAPEVTELVAKSHAQHVIYISCNPATLARDIALLSTVYKVEKLVPMDFFPQTPHVESCVLLVRK